MAPRLRPGSPLKEERFALGTFRSERMRVLYRSRQNDRLRVMLILVHIDITPPQNNLLIPGSQHTKYLDVILDNHFTFKQHITYIRNKFKQSVCKIYPLIARNCALSRENKLLIYKLILRPILTCAAPIWAHAARSHINQIEASQRIILRQILNALWFMRNIDKS
ncbi:RNA-directed DNA polymerase from mobile element jockey [Trichonephila clavipes]|nr:RNA-directed DNA polymerase from mobile element jockey [Trichonephila clavipes]